MFGLRLDQFGSLDDYVRAVSQKLEEHRRASVQDECELSVELPQGVVVCWRRYRPRQEGNPTTRGILFVGDRSAHTSLRFPEAERLIHQLAKCYPVKADE